MRGWARLLMILAAAAACAWALARWAFLPQSCNVAVTELTRRTALVGESRQHFLFIKRAQQNIEDLRMLSPRCATTLQIPILIAANQESLGRYEEAIRSYQDALRLDRRPEIHVSLAGVLIQLGRTDEAVDHLVIAARFNPGALENVASEEVVRRATERIRATP